MKPKDSAVLPLSLVADYGKKYPFVWDAAQQFREWPEADWDKSHCYIPIAAGCAICDHFKMPPDAVYMVPALAAWRQSKEVYTFDPDLADALYAQADDTKIPSKILMQLPFFCVYLDSGKYRFFCHLENDSNDGRWELRFVRIRENGSMAASYLHLGDYTISESILAGLDESQRVSSQSAPGKAMQDFAEYATSHPEKSDYSDIFDATVLGEMLQLVLYICADNADIKQPEENKRTYRGHSPGNVKDKFREVRKWDTGYYIGDALRKKSGGHPPYEKQPPQGGTKRPHMRRGHWHHYWRGKDGQKELVLHWVLPIFVNGNDPQYDSPARITPIK